MKIFLASWLLAPEQHEEMLKMANHQLSSFYEIKDKRERAITNLEHLKGNTSDNSNKKIHS